MPGGPLTPSQEVTDICVCVPERGLSLTFRYTPQAIRNMKRQQNEATNSKEMVTTKRNTY